MKHSFRFLFLALVLVVTACTGSDEPSSEQQKSDAENALYRGKLIGSWYSDTIVGQNKLYSMYDFWNDGHFTSRHLVMERDSVLAGGSEVWSFWTVAHDLHHSGKWQVCWSMDLDSPVVCLYVSQWSGNPIMCKFDCVTDSTFVFQDWVDGDMKTFKKGKPDDFFLR